MSENDVAVLSFVLGALLFATLSHRLSETNKVLRSYFKNKENNKKLLIGKHGVEIFIKTSKSIDKDLEAFITFKKGMPKVKHNFYYNKEGSSKSRSVFELMLIQKKTKVDMAIFASYLLLILYGLGSFLGMTGGFLWPALVIFFSPLIAKADCYLMTRRAASGEYGNNRFEAEEIIRFIVNNSDDDDGLGNPGKRVFPEPEDRAEGVVLGGATNER